MEFVGLPAGILSVGDNRLSDASPQHRIELRACGIGKFSMTNEGFAVFVNDGGYITSHYWTAMGGKALSARPCEK